MPLVSLLSDSFVLDWHLSSSSACTQNALRYLRNRIFFPLFWSLRRVIFALRCAVCELFDLTCRSQRCRPAGFKFSISVHSMRASENGDLYNNCWWCAAVHPWSASTQTEDSSSCWDAAAIEKTRFFLLSISKLVHLIRSQSKEEEEEDLDLVSHWPTRTFGGGGFSSLLSLLDRSSSSQIEKCASRNQTLLTYANLSFKINNSVSTSSSSSQADSVSRSLLDSSYIKIANFIMYLLRVSAAALCQFRLPVWKRILTSGGLREGLNEILSLAHFLHSELLFFFF